MPSQTQSNKTTYHPTHHTLAEVAMAFKASINDIQNWSVRSAIQMVARLPHNAPGIEPMIIKSDLGRMVTRLIASSAQKS